MSKSKLYTGAGDSGKTSLVGGERIAKDAVRLEAYGTIDELNSWLGLVSATSVCLPVEDPGSTFWTTLQSRLFDIGSYLATPADSPFANMTANPVTEADISALECAIDAVDGCLPKLNSFVIPGGVVGACNAQIARTVCRRAERRLVTLDKEIAVDPAVKRFINRLSDLLFAVARFNNINTGHAEIFWSKGC